MKIFQTQLSRPLIVLKKAIANRVAANLELPAPSTPKRGQFVIPVPAEAAATPALYLAIKDAGWSKVQLAAVLGVDEKEVRRLLDPHHASKLPRLEAALEKIGKRLVISVADVEEVAAGTK